MLHKPGEFAAGDTSVGFGPCSAGRADSSSAPASSGAGLFSPPSCLQARRSRPPPSPVGTPYRLHSPLTPMGYAAQTWPQPPLHQCGLKTTVSAPQVCATFAMIDTPPQPLYTRANIPVRTVLMTEEISMSAPHAAGWSRRQFLGGVTWAGAAGLLSLRPVPVAAEPPPETTRLRVHHSYSLCLAPQQSSPQHPGSWALLVKSSA
jgi:hypothetical protein